MLAELAVAVLVAFLGRVDAPAPTYRPPLDRPVEHGFDESHGRYGPGNRGLDYAVAPGDAVGAIGAGTVVFAGRVAGATWVTVLHPDGLRSSYGPLATTAVVAGDRVTLGEVLGATASTFHLGVRHGDTYLDPATLFEVRDRHAHLVPVAEFGGTRSSRLHFPPDVPDRPRPPSGPMTHGV